MNPPLLQKLARLESRAAELEKDLAQTASEDYERYGRLAQEHAQLEEIVALFRRWQEIQEELLQAQELLHDPETKDLAQEEIETLASAQEEIEKKIKKFLLGRDPLDDRNVFLEIRAGTGGEEAALFASELLRMYGRFAERRGWEMEVLSLSESESGGCKEAICKVCGRGAYAALKYESGVHRVQRVPATESQGRIHTSACTVAVLPEAEEVEVRIDPGDLRVDTYRASGAGGQHVNRTDSAVRLTHIPSGIVVECQDERSQHKNRARAMSILAAKLQERARRQIQEKEASMRRSQVGTGDRSEKIRTYHFPQARVTDHRINLTLHRLEQVLDGDLDEIIESLAEEAQAKALAEEH